MQRVLNLWLAAAVVLSIGPAPLVAQAPADAGIYAVSYVDVMPSGRTAMITALKRYRDVSSKETGYVRFDLLEQVGWSGHFMIIETWKDQGAFDAHVKAAGRARFQSALAPIRVSGYDERPYKSLNVGAGNADAKGIHVVSHVDIGGGDPAAQAAGAAILAQLANASRKERGLLRFDVLQHAMRANHFTIHEAWETQAAFDAHAAMHTGDFRDRIQPLLGGPVDDRLFRSIE